jgi:hypothetical protein
LDPWIDVNPPSAKPLRVISLYGVAVGDGAAEADAAGEGAAEPAGEGDFAAGLALGAGCAKAATDPKRETAHAKIAAEIKLRLGKEPPKTKVQTIEATPSPLQIGRTRRRRDV